jgi:glutamyl/glutaminyl-tRNA synthetase
LTKIIWTHPEGKDVYSGDDFIRMLDARTLPNTGPVADMKLLSFINGQYVSKYAPSDMVDLYLSYLDYLIDQSQTPTPTNLQEPPISLDVVKSLREEMLLNRPYAAAVLALEPERHQRLSDIIENCSFFFDATFHPATKDQLMRVSDDVASATSILKLYADRCLEPPDHDQFRAQVRDIALAHGVKDKIVFMLARVALCGSEKTPPLLDIMKVLGPHKSRHRIYEAANMIPGRSANQTMDFNPK